jgi:hypothetical protein
MQVARESDTVSETSVVFNWKTVTWDDYTASESCDSKVPRALRLCLQFDQPLTSNIQ